MKKSRKQKRNKKWRMLILLLFITIIMFGTSTYAWFTANRVVTIQSINVNVEASNGIQISTNAESWKSVITNADITTNAYSGHNNQLPATVTAVSTDGTVDTATGDTKGRLKMYLGSVDNDATSGAYTLTATRDTEPGGSSGHFVAFDIFLRVDQTRQIYLTDASDVINTDNTDKGLKNAARVAFVYLGHGNSTDSAATLTALNSPAATAIIWEPNADAHTQIVQTSVAPEYGVTVTGNTTDTYGLIGPITNPVDLITVVRTGKIGTTDYGTKVTPDIITSEGNNSYHAALNLTAGVTKYRVYMWIEGQDIDCENNATGSNIRFNVQFSTESSASGSGSSSSSSESSSG